MPLAQYHDIHRGEPILADCPLCKLPIYQSDIHRLSNNSWDICERLYHTSCARQAEGYHWEKMAKADADRLRGCGYVVELKIIRPMR